MDQEIKAIADGITAKLNDCIAFARHGTSSFEMTLRGMDRLGYRETPLQREIRIFEAVVNFHRGRMAL